MLIQFNYRTTTTIKSKLLDFKPFESIISDSLYVNSNNYQFLKHQYPSTYPLINDVGIYIDTDNDIDTEYISITEDVNPIIQQHSSANFPLFFDHKNNIKIPAKVEYALRRHTPRGLLKEIYPDFNVAVELCLLYVSQLSSTYFDVRSGYNPEGWKALNSRYLRDLLSIDPQTYKKVRIVLEYPLKTGPILMCDYSSIEGRKSYHHRLGDAYILKGIKSYELKTQTAIKLLNKRFLRTYGLAITNPICKNLIELYPYITLPSKEDIIAEAKRLINQKYLTPKGKRLAFLNKHPRSYFRHPERMSFVEDALEIYDYLTQNGLMIPIEGSEESGGRVVDSFTLMPSWIRRLVKIDGKPYVEADYSCLHPNIAMNLYGGNQEYLTHTDVAKASGLDMGVVKIEHLSFFNKKIWQMKLSPLYSYYEQNEPLMMERLISEKQTSSMKHKVTSMRMFEMEVRVMKDVISKLNKEGIHVGYVYDALFCHPKHAKRVKEVMDFTIQKHGIKTQSKLSTRKEDNSISKENTILKSTVKLKVITFEELNQNTSIKESILNLTQKGKEIKFEEVIIDFGEGDCFNEKVLRVNDEFNPKKKYMPLRFLYG